MKKLALVGSKVYCDDEMLDGNSPLDPDRRLTCMRELRDGLKKKGIQLVHHSQTTPENTWGYMFFNYDEKPLGKLISRGYAGKLFLLVCENEVISPKNWDVRNHKPFDAVFTWDMRAFPESVKPLYVRYFLPNDLSTRIAPLPWEKREKLCVMMAANKWKRRPRELYSERFKAIRWFMKEHPGDFDLYGYDWTYGPFKKNLERLRNFFRHLRGRPTRPVDVSPVYRGPVTVKREVLSRYKFCLCYENAIDIPGYITEKIFDCFLAGTVPVYLGWKGAEDFIPAGAFVDFRSFRGYGELYEYLSSVGPKEFQSYIDIAGEFLSGTAVNRFKPSAFAGDLIGGMEKFFAEE